MNKEDWLIIPRDITPVKRQDPYNRLLEMMNQLEEERGYRFTDEQADAIKTLIINLIDQIKESKNDKKR